MEKKTLNEFQEFKEDRFSKRVIYQKNESVVFVLNFMPGQELPSHTHPGTDVYLLALEGSGTVTVDGNDSSVVKGEIVHIGGDETFSYRNTGSEPSSLYVTLIKLPDERYAQNI